MDNMDDILNKIKTVSIDMSTCDEDADRRIFARPIELQGDTLLCEFDCANYDYKSKKPKNEVIPKLPSNRFLFENWNREFCINYSNMYENKEFIKSKIIGWCESSKVFARKRDDENDIAIMLDDNTWCHFPKFAIECLVGKDMHDFWNFEGLDRKIIDDYVTQKKWRL